MKLLLFAALSFGTSLSTYIRDNNVKDQPLETLRPGGASRSDTTGQPPYAADSTYQYYRTAIQYGADSTGKNDSSDAINNAINAWNRTANTVTTLPAYIYIPPGTYLITKPIQLLVNTFLIGDALSPNAPRPPFLNTTPVIVGFDAHQGEGSANKNFYMAVRNVHIDTTGIASNVVARGSPDGYQAGKMYPIQRPSGLLVNGKYFTTPLPQYEKYDISQVVSVKEDPEHKVYGDNSHDDGPAINAILLKHANCKIIFFPQGIYRTNQTIYIPPGSRLIGEVLSTISGAGPFFTNPSNPQPIIKIGNLGERGIAQLTDLLFTVSDILPGAIIVEINMSGPAPGDVSLINSVIRVGGSADSLVTTSCGSSDPSTCKAAFALLHLTPSSSAYLEDVWGWVADHSLDGPESDPPQNIAVGRGALIESTSPTWLVGTSFEHCVLYQYSLRNAANLYIGQQQTEAPYWQGQGTVARAPEPWVVNGTYGDPDFGNCKTQEGMEGEDRCYRAWGMRMVQPRDVVIHGSAMWSFFNRMDDNMWSDPQCMKTGGFCQMNMVWVEGARRTWWFGVSSKSTENLVVDAGSRGGEVVVTSQKDNPGVGERWLLRI
ncbi:hypothetical protein N0V88_001027 [Collariella sp. IMI 366227]|nr:hypothetical protein N0V88_001027 [Collariella sp. IMI 366227]